ncbi:MAG: DUF1353 domain-containing protein [Sulfurihydrogenibium sp.]|jgi:hypothetical protein|nr:DUF1353 domain-containing protein [Sulfurihydrogenibium sp.]
MRLLTPLKVELESNGKKWKLSEKFIVFTEQAGEEKIWIEVEEGFETDFASIPKVFIPFLQWRDKFNKASVIHDWLYHTKMFDRKTADRVFLELMLALGINKFKAYLFYYVVRVFGWTHWRKK